MTATPPPRARHLFSRAARAAASRLPRRWRQAVWRGLVDCGPQPAVGLALRIAESADEFEACFALARDAGAPGATPWHALPSTTTVCAVLGGEIVGTLTLVRDGVFGLPMQSAFDLSPVRARGGPLAEVMALAVRRDFRHAGGGLLFPLLKFAYEYSTRCSDTRHLVFAAPPGPLELCEALLPVDRLAAEGARDAGAMVAASVDLQRAPERLRAVYGGRMARRDLHAYFTRLALPQLVLPPRRYFTTNDPVMTPALLDHLFNRQSRTFAALDARQRRLLHSVYDAPAYAAVLPPLDADDAGIALRRHPRHSIRFPALFTVPGPGGVRRSVDLREISLGGCQVELLGHRLHPGEDGELVVHLGQAERAVVRARVVRQAGACAWGLAVDRPDAAWRACVAALEGGETYRALSLPAAAAESVAA